MDRRQKKNTVGFEFGRSGAMPSLKEAVSFIAKDLGIKDTDVHSVYRDPAENIFFVKFKDESALKEVTKRLKATETFRYGDGREVTVHVAVADGFFRYVRIFNLPPEVTDDEIAAAMAKFGTIRQLVREKLPTDLSFNAYSGIRGVHMEVKSEIPAAMYIGHFKCRIFYEGLRNRCFICKQEGHVKAECPTKVSVQQRLDSHDEGTPGNQPAPYASVAKGLSRQVGVEGGSIEMPTLHPQQKQVLQKPMDDIVMDVSPLRVLENEQSGTGTLTRASRSKEKTGAWRVVGKAGRSFISPENPGKAVEKDTVLALAEMASKRSRSRSVVKK